MRKKKGAKLPQAPPSLVMALKKAREAGCRLVLQDLNPQVRLVLELTGTDRVFEIVASGSESAS